MQQLTSFLRRFRLGRMVAVFLAGFALLMTTACNPGPATGQGANPTNPAVQLGGNNNPHQGSGDSFTNSEVYSNPKLENAKANKAQQKRADLQLLSGQLIAATTVNTERDASGMLYPGSGSTGTGVSKTLSNREQDILNDTQEFPKQRQPVLDRSNSDVKILEKVGETFKDASAFIKDTSDAAGERPELQSNPARH